jgi:hypothetical protein
VIQDDGHNVIMRGRVWRCCRPANMRLCIRLRRAHFLNATVVARSAGGSARAGSWGVSRESSDANVPPPSHWEGCE